MAFTNFDTKEIHCKVLYLGPRGAGKTENLRSLMARMSAGAVTVVPAEAPQTAPFFEFLPLSVGDCAGYTIKVHLFTLPTPKIYPIACDVVLTGCDGWVYVADSRVEGLPGNVRCLEECDLLLQRTGQKLNSLPGVFQFNRQDASQKIAPMVLSRELNPLRRPEFQAIANQSIGTVETLLGVAKLVLQELAGV